MSSSTLCSSAFEAAAQPRLRAGRQREGHGDGKGRHSDVSRDEYGQVSEAVLKILLEKFGYTRRIANLLGGQFGPGDT